MNNVIDNLKRTIASKEMLLATYRNPEVLTKPVRNAMVSMLELNIKELKAILEDVEAANVEVKKYRDFVEEYVDAWAVGLAGDSYLFVAAGKLIETNPSDTEGAGHANAESKRSS